MQGAEDAFTTQTVSRRGRHRVAGTGGGGSIRGFRGRSRGARPSGCGVCEGVLSRSRLHGAERFYAPSTPPSHTDHRTNQNTRVDENEEEEG